MTIKQTIAATFLITATLLPLHSMETDATKAMEDDSSAPVEFTSVSAPQGRRRPPPGLSPINTQARPLWPYQEPVYQRHGDGLRRMSRYELEERAQMERDDVVIPRILEHRLCFAATYG